MTRTSETEGQPQELAHRASGGVEVVLLWRKADNRLTVSVADSKAGDGFELVVEGRDALDVFYHPYAYAAFRGVEFRTPSLELDEAVAV